MTDLMETIARAIAGADQEDYMEDCERYDDRARAAYAAIEAAGFAVVPKEAAGITLVAVGTGPDFLAAAPKVST